METSPVTCRTLEDFYHINANTLTKQYKNVLSVVINGVRLPTLRNGLYSRKTSALTWP